jgi:hypothetical protein
MRPPLANVSSEKLATLLEETATFAPSCAKRCATARPIPLLAAVTNAYLPLNCKSITAPY